MVYLPLIRIILRYCIETLDSQKVGERDNLIKQNGPEELHFLKFLLISINVQDFWKSQAKPQSKMQQ